MRPAHTRTHTQACLGCHSLYLREPCAWHQCSCAWAPRTVCCGLHAHTLASQIQGAMQAPHGRCCVNFCTCSAEIGRHHCKQLLLAKNLGVWWRASANAVPTWHVPWHQRTSACALRCPGLRAMWTSTCPGTGWSGGHRWVTRRSPCQSTSDAGSYSTEEGGGATT